MAAAPPSVSTRASVTTSEVLVGGITVALLVLAETSLLLADLRVWSLPANLLLAAVVLVAIRAAIRRHRANVVHVPSQLIAVLAVAVLAALFSVPGFPVGHAGLDPGVYTNHALAIERTGSYDVADPTLAQEKSLPDLAALDARFPAMTENPLDDDRTIVGYFHLYPALMAPAAAIAGERGVVNVNPLLAIIAAALVLLVAWRVFGPTAGVIAGVLTATNMIQVWHARYPTSEMLTEVIVLLALLAIVLAIDARSTFAAVLAGACTTLTFLARADGFLLVALAAFVLVALAALGRFDRRATWFTVSAVALLPHAFLQAYHLVGEYTAKQGVLGAARFAGALVGLALIGAVLAGARRVPTAAAVVTRIDSLLGRRRWQRLAGTAVVALTLLVLAVNYARPLWSGERPADPNLPGENSYYNARALLRLTWFFTPLGIALAVVGLTVIAWRRWSAPRWLVVAPALTLLPLYLLNAHVAIRLMWWTRRFVPIALPGLLLLIACGLAAMLSTHQVWLRRAGAVLTVVLVAWWGSMSWPLRAHHELEGSFGIYQALVDVADDEPAVWLWATFGTPEGVDGVANAFASTMLLRRGDASALFDRGRGGEAVDAYRTAFPGRQIYVVVDGEQAPDDLAGRLTFVKPVAVDLPIWETTFDRRPTGTGRLPYRFTIWQAA
jgi:hypothetical protein